VYLYRFKVLDNDISWSGSHLFQWFILSIWFTVYSLAFS